MWHYATYAYLDEGGSIEDYPDFHLNEETIDMAIPHIADWLTNKEGY